MELAAVMSPLALTFSRSTPPPPSLRARRLPPASASLTFTPAATELGGGGFSPSALRLPKALFTGSLPLPRSRTAHTTPTIPRITKPITEAVVLSINGEHPQKPPLIQDVLRAGVSPEWRL